MSIPSPFSFRRGALHRAIVWSAVSWILAPLAGAAETYQPVNTQTSGTPLGPREATQRLTLPEGFKLTLAASEPDVRQPIAMCHDDRGRLWVAESYSYDGSDFTAERHDRILIFEDADGDGVFESRKVFHDRLNRLTGLVVGFGGVWVTTAPTLSFIPDRNADDVPDGEPEVRIDGWTLKAEHNTVNGLAWGPDGWLYGRHGIKEPSRPGIPGTPKESRREISCSIWRYHPVRQVFDVVAEGSVNPWGLDWDDLGQAFMGTSVVDHLWHVVPGARFKRWLGRDLPLYPHIYELMESTNDHSHRSPNAQGEYAGGHSHSAAMIYLGDRWPETYRGSVFMSNIHGRRVNRDVLRTGPDGRLSAAHAPDFVQADDPWFRAVSLEYGPDGDVVMSDWSDNGECHDRDGVHRTSGRIYKISWGEPRRVVVDLARATTDELVACQAHRNEWFVRHARRILQERAAAGADLRDAHHALRATFEKSPETRLRLRALWALHVTQGIDPDWLVQQLDDSDPHVRHWAIRLLTDAGSVNAIHGAALLAAANRESAWLVNLAFASALPSLAPDARWDLGATLVRWLRPDDDPNLTRLIWFGWHDVAAQRAAETMALVPSLSQPRLAEWIGRRMAEHAAHEPTLVAALLDTAGRSDRNRAAFLAGAALGLEVREYPLDGDAAAVLRPWYELPSALTLGAKLRDPLAIERLQALLASDGAENAVRAEALRTLTPLRPAWLPGLLLELLGRRQLVEPVLRAMASLKDVRFAPAIVAAYPKIGRALRGAAIDALAARESSLEVLLDALAGGRIGKADISHSQARQILNAATTASRQRFELLWGRLNQTSASVTAQMRKLRITMKPDFLALGNVAHGRTLFEQRCAACHTLFGNGGKVGPDLTGGGRKEIDYLIINIVDPNAAIPADWRLTVVTLADGRVVSGSVASESESAITVLSAEGTTVLERKAIAKVERMNTSLMPVGLLDDLSPDHVRDLFAFLMSDPGKAAAAR